MKKTLILSLFFLLLLPVIVNAETVQTGKFKFLPAFEQPKEEVYYYSDDYFTKSGKIDDEHLLAMSYNLSISTFEVRGYSYSSTLLTDIGFKDVQAYDMEEKPTIDTIGVVIAHKEIDGKNVIAVAVRGEKYDSEWGNNFIVGKTGNAKGFNDSSIKVIERIKKYISDKNLNNNKIWLVGYSRAGAISNLTGVYINNHLDEFSTNADDLYVYTFEAPAASLDDTVYDNIYTVRSVNDLIPFVYPKEWGFHTNGKIINLGEAKTIKTYTGLEEQEEYIDVEMNEFYGQFFSWLTSRLPRDTYVDSLEQPVSKIFDIYFGKSDEDREKLKNFVMVDLKNELLNNPANFNRIKSRLWSILGHNSDYLYHYVVDVIIEVMDSLRNTENASVLTDEEYNSIVNSLYPALRVIGPIIVDDTNYYDGIDYDAFYASDVPDYYMQDAEMGKKWGIQDGFDIGYEAGFNGLEKNSTPEKTDSEYGPTYLSAYQTYYVDSYLDAYDLGVSHRNDLYEKGKYEANRYGAYNIGYFDGNQRNECVTYNPYFYPEDYDYANEAFINGYNEEYEKQYLLGYAEGQKFPTEEEPESPELKPLYHLLSLFKNANDIISMHIPQENLKLIHSYDSYYAHYYLTEGANQVIINDDGNEDNLTFKTSGHLEKLIKVQVDNIDLTSGDCDLRVGSTIVTLKDSFLKTLSAGTHTLKLIYIDNTITTTFKVNNSSNTSNQQSNNNQSNNIEDSVKTDIESIPKTININNQDNSDNSILYTSMIIFIALGFGVLLFRFIYDIYVIKKQKYLI